MAIAHLRFNGPGLGSPGSRAQATARLAKRIRVQEAGGVLVASVSTVLAVWGAVTGTFGAALALFAYRRDRPVLAVKADYVPAGRMMKTFPLSVTNRGREPATIVLIGFRLRTLGWRPAIRKVVSSDSNPSRSLRSLWVRITFHDEAMLWTDPYAVEIAAVRRAGRVELPRETPVFLEPARSCERTVEVPSITLEPSRAWKFRPIVLDHLDRRAYGPAIRVEPAGPQGFRGRVLR